jgi:CRISPR-associated protein (TIGR03985 family)
MPTLSTPPTVDLLKRLVRNSLKQSLPKAVRLWVILQSLYGDDADRVVPEKFTYPDWEQSFFSHGHDFGRDVMPTRHAPACSCAQSLEYWLFETSVGIDPASWRSAFCQAFNLTAAELLTLLHRCDRLFAVTGRSLENDFETLVNAGCLQFQIKPDGKPYKNRYEKVAVLPKILSETTAESSFVTAAEYIQTDLSEFVDALAQPIQGVQRFFLHTEYVVPRCLIDQVSDYQVQLKECWNQSEVPPIHLTYCSAREFQEELKWLVYPVCVFYYQRAPYLFAYGHQLSDDKLQWYDFRLDHVMALAVLDWQHSGLHPELLARRADPPTPDDIHLEMSDSWGFEFYRPSQQLVLRFDPYFYANYIGPTERAALFTAMTRSEVSKQISKVEDHGQRCALEQVIKHRSDGDVYCRIQFRSGDRNILMRLRAWSPNVEVILPFGLRDQIAQEVQKMGQMYG